MTLAMPTDDTSPFFTVFWIQPDFFTSGEAVDIVKVFQKCHTFEPHRDKINKMVCVPSEDSDQPGHPPSLVRVFTVRLIDSQVSQLSSSGQRRLIGLGGCPG